MAHGDNQAATEHAFDVVLRGYDRRQVDDHIAGLEGRLAATARECTELRMQRDAEASRARDLESRVAAGPGAPASPARAQSAPPVAPPAAARETWSSFDGLGAKVEAIMRVAAEEAEGIRRSAVESGRKHAEAEDRLRSTFQSISERLQPLVSRLDEDSTAARAAVNGTTSDAGALERAAEQQAKAMTEAAAATAARMRADAETRVEITARQAADVREELALVRQILTSLGPTTAGQADPGPAGPADSAPADSAPANSASADGAPANSAPATGPVNTAPGGSAPDAPEQPHGAAAQTSGPAGTDTFRTGTVRVPSMSGARSPQTPGAGAATAAPATGGAVSMAKPDGSDPAARGPAGPAFRGAANDAPTETIALPLIDPAEAEQTGTGSTGGQRHQQS